MSFVLFLSLEWREAQAILAGLLAQNFTDNTTYQVYCLLVNRAKFQREQVAQGHQQNVCHTRALLCEIVANRVLRRFVEDNPGAQGLLLLAQILVGGFDPFQGAPAEILEENSQAVWAFHSRNGQKRKLPALEVAIISESKIFLSSAACQKIVSAIYEGRVIYTPSSFLDILPDHYKQRPISLYNPRKAPLLNQYRMIVPRTRNYLEVIQFVILLVLFLCVMSYRDHTTFRGVELVFIIYSVGWILDQFSSVLEHGKISLPKNMFALTLVEGWHVYTQNLWSFLDVTFSCIFFVYLALRIQGHRTSSIELGNQAMDVLAMGAPVLIPRLAFNLMSENMLFVSLRAMMRDFTILTLLAVWCFAGFLLSMTWLANGSHEPITISKWMLWVWFGLDGTGIQRSVDFHWLLGPILMVAFAFLGNTLFLTILVSMLSTTFSTIASNATAEIQFRRAVLTFEGVKSDAIFAYQPPFNILALLILLPLKFIVTPRWFHKINVAAQRTLNLPILLSVSLIERRMLWSGHRRQKDVEPLHKSHSRAGLWDFSRGFSVHGDISRVFESAPPDEEEEDEEDENLDASEDDELEIAPHLFHGEIAAGGECDDNDENRFAQAFGQASNTSITKASNGNSTGNGTIKYDGPDSPKLTRTPTAKSMKSIRRRDSVVPWATKAGGSELGDLMLGGGDFSRRLEALEKSNERIERMLARLCDDLSDGEEEGEGEGARESADDGSGRFRRGHMGETGTLADLDRSGTADLDD